MATTFKSLGGMSRQSVARKMKKCCKVVAIGADLTRHLFSRTKVRAGAECRTIRYL